MSSLCKGDVVLEQKSTLTTRSITYHLWKMTLLHKGSIQFGMMSQTKLQLFQIISNMNIPYIKIICLLYYRAKQNIHNCVYMHILMKVHKYGRKV